MGSILCSALISESSIVLLKTPSQNTGSVSLHMFSHPSYSGPQINLQLSTDCGALTVPAGAYPLGIITAPNEYTFAFDLSSHSDEGVSLCGHITASTNEEGCVEEIEIPVYVWNVKDTNDMISVCGAIMPSAIYVDVDDSSTYQQFFPIIRTEDPGESGANSNLYNGGCPYGTVDLGGSQGPNGGADYQLNYIGESIVYPVTFDPSGYDGCGQTEHVCTFVASQIYQLAGAPTECEQDINVYFSAQCAQRDCPISWGTSSQDISKNAGDTGSFIAPIVNSQGYEITVEISTDCPYLTVPTDPIVIAASSTEQVEVFYDLSGYSQCGTNDCGDVTATVTYLEVESCARKFDVAISYECVTEQGDDYITRLYDEEGTQTVQINEDCSLITIMDASVFGQFGHAVSDFQDYRKITITNQQTGIEYVMSSLNPTDGSDELINPASSGDLVFTHAVSVGGVYEVRLCNVPTYGDSNPYQANDDVVWVGGKFFAAINDSQGVHPINSPNTLDNWVEITEEQLGDYSDKYCDTQIVISSCNLDQCFAEKYKSVACDIGCNNLELCKNESFLNVLIMDYMLVYLDEAIADNDMESATTIYDKLNQICTC